MKCCELVEAFDIEDGSLQGLPPEQVFILGVEWATFRQRLSESAPFTMVCLLENRPRLVAMAERNGRFVEDRQTSRPDLIEVWVGDYIS